MQPVEQSQRARRVRFKHPVRVATIDGEPRAWRTLAANLSREGLFVRMPQPLDPGTRVAISLEAAGQTLPLAQGEVRWCRYHPSELDGRFQGCGVRFTGFLHPRAPELVHYLVDTLDTGRPLTAAPPRRRRWPWALAAGLVVAGVASALLLVLMQPEPPPLPEATDSPGPLGVLAIAPKVNDELASLVSPAEEASHDVEAAAESPGSAAPAEVAVVPADARDTGPAAERAVVAADAMGEGTGTGAPVPGDARGAQTTPDVAVVPAAETAAGAAPDLSARGTAAAAGVADVPAGASSPRVPPEPSVRGTTAPAGVADVPAGASSARVPPEPSARGTAAPAGVADVPAGASSARVPPEPSARGTAATPEGRLALPTGAAATVSWKPSPDGLDIRPTLRGDARIARVFSLADPPRLVFDIDGAAPKKSLSLGTASPLISRVRLGKQGARTRVVIDLAATPQHVRSASDHAVVRF